MAFPLLYEDDQAKPGSYRGGEGSMKDHGWNGHACTAHQDFASTFPEVRKRANETSREEKAIKDLVCFVHYMRERNRVLLTRKPAP